MSNLTRQKILEKLENFNEYLDYLNQLKKEIKNEKSFISDFHLFGNTERYLQLCIQIIMDACQLIIIDLDLTRPDDNYEAVSVLYGKKVFSGSLASEITKMIGLRNILVHEYGKIDRKKIYKVLKENLDDLKLFQKAVVKYVNSK